MLTIEINDFESEMSKRLARASNPRAILAVSGRELSKQLKSHFRDRDRSDPNKLSPRRSHFWLEVAQSVSQPFSTGTNSITVRVSDPRIEHKVKGGPITAKKAGALTIPVEERAYGRTAATFEQETGLRLILIKSGKGKFERAVLGVREGGPKAPLTIEYLLTPSVDQPADPDALPDENTLRAAILARAQKALDRQVETA